MTEPTPALSLSATTWSVELQRMLLERLARFGRPHRYQPARRPNDGVYVHPSLPLAQRLLIQDALSPLTLPFIDDSELDPSQVEVHLRSAQKAPPIRLHIATDSPLRARRMAEALAPLIRIAERPDIVFVPLSGRSEGILYGSATPPVIEVARFITGHLGGPTTAVQTFAEADPDLLISFAAPAGTSAKSEVPIIVVTDDPEGSPEPAALVAALEAEGYAEVSLQHVNPGMPRPEGFELLVGAVALYGEAAVSALKTQLHLAMQQAGVDLSRFPIEVLATPVNPTEPLPELSALALACVNDPRAPLAAHLIFPCRRARGGTLRTTAAHHATGHSVEITGDDPVVAAKVAGVLVDAGFDVKVGPLGPDHFETAIEVGAMHSHAALMDGVRAALAQAGVEAPPFDHRADLGRRSRITLITGLSSEERAERLAAACKGYSITLYTEDSTRSEIRALRAALMREGVRLRVSSDREPDEYEIMYGGAPPCLVRRIAALIGKHYLPVADVDPRLRQAWSRDDHDIFIHLPKVGASGAAEAQPQPDAFAAWLDAEPAGDVPAIPFLEAEGGRLRVGTATLPIRGENIHQRADLAMWVVDRTAAKALQHLAGAVARREPALLEGNTATSKTSAILFLAAQLGQPVTRVNLSAHADTAELIGRFLPEPGGGWRWSDGAVVRALKRGEWLVLDELNLADPGVLERLNPLLEAEPSLVVTEHAGERLGPGGAPIHPDFRVFATLNPATYSGRQRLSPALRDRFLTSAVVDLPTEADLLVMLHRLVLGDAPAFDLDGRRYAEARVAPLSPWSVAPTETRSAARLLSQLARLFAGLIASAAAPASALNDEERPVTTRRGLLSLIREVHLATTAGEPLDAALKRALIRVLVARAGHPDHRAALAALMDSNGLGPTTWAPGALPASPTSSREPARVPAR
jgi:MoxR-like ATPase